MKAYGKVWFHAAHNGPAVQWLHESLVSRVHEYFWRSVDEASDGTGEMHGWFRPLDIHATDEFAAIPGVTILPDLADPTPVGSDLETLLSYANVKKGDTPYAVAKKLHQYHKDKHGAYYPELKPSYY